MGEPPDSSLGHAYLCNSNPRERNTPKKTRRRMARERRGAESSVVSMETLYWKTIY